MSVIPMAALTVGALLLALGLTSSSRQARRDKRGDGGDAPTWSGSDGSDGGDCGGDCGGDGGGCD